MLHFRTVLCRLPIAAGCALCLFGSASRSATLFVNAAATGAVHDGTSWESAFLTVGAAVSAAGAGDEVWVAAGVYAERLTAAQPVHLYGGFAGTEAQRDQRDPVANLTVLDGQKAGTILTITSTAADGTLDGFTLRNGNAGTSADGGAVAGTGASWTIRHNIFTGNTGRFGGALSLRSGRPTVTGNLFTKNSASVAGGAAYCSSTTATFANNTFAANSISGGSSQHSGAMDAYRATVTLVNNIIAYNTPGGIDKDHYSGSTYAYRNNAAFSNAGYDYPNFENPTGANGNVRTDPKFVNRATGDFHLTAGSRCIDAGDDTAVTVPDTDMDGQARIQSAHVDIGADEFPGARVPLSVPRLYVRATGNDDNDGTAWTRAKKTVQAALDDALAPGGEVWVAAGTYAETLVLWPGVALYGGFTGGETALEQRDPAKNVTTLNANSAGCGVLIPIGAGPETVLDGFAIANGKGYTIGTNKTAGGGVYCAGSSPTIRRNRFSSCSATQGVVYCSGETAPVVEANTFSSNSATGVFCVNGSDAAITGNTFSNNTASASVTYGYGSPTGGGVYAYKCSPAVRGNTFTGNSGGAVGGIQSDAVVSGNTFSGNTSKETSAGVSWQTGSPTITHNAFTRNETDAGGGGLSGTFTGGRIGDNTFLNNIAGGFGGGMYVSGPVVVANNTVVGNSQDNIYDYNNHGGGIALGTGSPTLVNNLVAYNSSGIAAIGGLNATPILRNNCTAGNQDADYDGLPDPTGSNGNISADPKLAGYSYGEIHLQPDSPCRDAGDDASSEPGGSDMDGQARVLGAHVDIGADETDGATVAFTPYVVRVRLQGNDGNDGASWATAMQSIWGAIYRVRTHGSGEVWVAEGDYSTPDTLLPLYTFCHLYGGFAGTETSRNQRDPSTHLTRIASADPNPTVVAMNGALWCTLDGFSIGNAGTNAVDCWQCARPLITNNVFTGIAAATSPYGRVAIYARDNARPVITGNVFRDNKLSGAAIVTVSGSPVVTKNVFTGNVSGYEGGGVSIHSAPNAEVANNVFRGNTGQQGGGIAFVTSAGRIVDNVVVNNTATKGGGIFVTGSYSGKGEKTIIANNTVVGNTAADGGGIALASTTSALTVANNIVAFNGSGIFGETLVPAPGVSPAAS